MIRWLNIETRILMHTENALNVIDFILESLKRFRTVHVISSF